MAPQETPLNTAQIPSKSILPSSASTQMTLLPPEPRRHLFQGGPHFVRSLGITAPCQLCSPKGDCLSCPSMGSALATSCAAQGQPGSYIPPKLGEISAGSPADHTTKSHINGITRSANGQTSGFRCFRTELAVALLKAGWFCVTLCSFANKHN